MSRILLLPYSLNNVLAVPGNQEILRRRDCLAT